MKKMQTKREKIYTVAILIILIVFTILTIGSYNSGFKEGYNKGAKDMVNYIYEQATARPTIDYCDKPYWKEGNWYCEAIANGR